VLRHEDCQVENFRLTGLRDNINNIKIEKQFKLWKKLEQVSRNVPAEIVKDAVVVETASVVVATVFVSGVVVAAVIFRKYRINGN